MESRIYPTWEQLNNQNQSLTDGERALLKYLDDYLPKDNNWNNTQPLQAYQGWLIFAQPYLNGSRPDIIVFNPFFGGVVIEVKDWDLKNYSWRPEKKNGEIKDKLFVSDKNGSYPIKSPLTQVIHYKEIIIGQLAPLLGEQADLNGKAYGLFKVAVYFHNENTKIVEAFFRDKVKDFKYLPMFGKDYLSTPESIRKIIPNSFQSKSNFWNREWNKDLLFWFKPPIHSIEQGSKITLVGEQIKIGEPASGHFRVRGVAGSGKTLALAYRAAKLASQNKKVLVITYNITLWHFIKDMIARGPFKFSWSQFNFSHFHGFCKDVLNKLDKDWPESPDRDSYTDSELFESAQESFFRITVPNTVIASIQNQDYEKYDAILIDEGQDFYVEWYALLNKYFLTSHDELLVVLDKKQNTYERELDWFDKRTRNVELEKFKTDITTLTTSYRLPERIIKMANEFSELFQLDQELKVKNVNKEMTLLYSNHIVWKEISNIDIFNLILDTIKNLTQSGESASDIVVLLPTHKIGIQCVKLLEMKKFKVNHISEDEDRKLPTHKKSFWMGDSRLKMSTIYSFKGWELMNIIMYIPEKAFESDKRLDMVVYTALTRSRNNLIILNENKRYTEFGKRFPHKWDKQKDYS